METALQSAPNMAGLSASHCRQSSSSGILLSAGIVAVFMARDRSPASGRVMGSVMQFRIIGLFTSIPNTSPFAYKARSLRPPPVEARQKMSDQRALSPTALMEPGMIGLMEPGEPGDFAFLDGVIFWSFVTLFFSRIVYRSGPVLASGNFCRRGSTGRRCA